MKILFTVFTFILVLTSDALPQEDWSWQNPKPQGNALFSVNYFDINNIIAFGTNGTVLKSSDGGDIWYPATFGNGNYFNYSTTVISPNLCWAVGINFNTVSNQLIKSMMAEKPGKCQIEWNQSIIIVNIFC